MHGAGNTKFSLLIFFWKGFGEGGTADRIHLLDLGNPNTRGWKLDKYEDIWSDVQFSDFKRRKSN